MKLSEKIKSIQESRNLLLARTSENRNTITYLQDQIKISQRQISDFSSILIKIEDYMKKIGDHCFNNPVLCRECGRVWDSGEDISFGLTYPCQECYQRLEAEEPSWRLRTI